MRCMLVGNYGVGNLGDEALREYFLTTFPDVHWQVISASPDSTEFPRLPAGLQSFFTTPWWRTLGALYRADALVFGGGSLFTDVESVQACVIWGIHAFAARCLGKRIVFAFQGVGPFRTTLGEGIARWAVRRAAFVSVRDPQSAARLVSFVKNTKVIQTADPVFLRFYSDVSYSIKNVIIVIHRHQTSATLNATLSHEQSTYPDSEIHILSMQPDDTAEQAACEALVKAFPASKTRIVPVRTVTELLQSLSAARVVVTERYHGALAALALGKSVRIIHQGEGDKHHALARLVEEEGLEGARKSLFGRARLGEEALRHMLES